MSGDPTVNIKPSDGGAFLRIVKLRNLEKPKGKTMRKSFKESAPGRLQLELVTHAEIGVAPKQNIVGLVLETKWEFDYETPTQFQCALTPDQAMKIGKELLDAGLELKRPPS